MKLSDYKGEDAVVLLGQIMDPLSEIIGDDDVKNAFRSDDRMGMVKPILSNHPGAIIEIMAKINGEDPEEFKPKVNIFTLPVMVMELIADDDFMGLFTLQSQTGQAARSGSATENIGENGD